MRVAPRFAPHDAPAPRFFGGLCRARYSANRPTRRRGVPSRSQPHAARLPSGPTWRSCTGSTRGCCASSPGGVCSTPPRSGAPAGSGIRASCPRPTDPDPPPREAPQGPHHRDRRPGATRGSMKDRRRASASRPRATRPGGRALAQPPPDCHADQRAIDVDITTRGADRPTRHEDHLGRSSGWPVAQAGLRPTDLLVEADNQQITAPTNSSPVACPRRGAPGHVARPAKAARSSRSRPLIRGWPPGATAPQLSSWPAPRSGPIDFPRRRRPDAQRCRGRARALVARRWTPGDPRTAGQLFPRTVRAGWGCCAI